MDDFEHKVNEIENILTIFCRSKLNNYYKDICLNILKDLASHPNNPLKRGKVNIWAAGIVCAVSQFTPMFEKYETTHTSIKEVCFFFDVKNPTVYSKARSIMKMLNIEKAPRVLTLRK